jgi:cysteine-S-conjugate beta-lyase
MRIWIVGTNRLLTHLSDTQGIVVHHVDTTDADEIKQVLNANTRMILLETPTNPLIKICDLKQICKIAHDFDKDILIVVDNTMMSPYLQRPLEYGVDMVYHSGTKYLSGHHDLMAGVIGIASKHVAEVFLFSFNTCK